MWLIQLGEVIFGGVGSGLYGMLVFAIVTVFIAGLMVGRTPEYLGKKIEAFEMKMASMAILIIPLLCCCGTAIAVVAEPGKARSPILERTDSAKSSTPSPRPATTTAAPLRAFSANTPFYNTRSGIAMLFARYWLACPGAGDRRFAGRKENRAGRRGTLPTHTPLFVVFLVGTVVLVGALTFVPALALGPVVEHLHDMAK